MPSSFRPNATRSLSTTRERQCGIAMFWPIPVEPRVSRRFNILNSIASSFSSSCNNPTSSFNAASLVVLSICRLIASSEKNSRNRTGRASPQGSGAKRNDWLPEAQRAITLCHMQFPYRVAHDIPLLLAPMAGVSESPFRLLCRRFGADAVVSEFISAVGISRGIERVIADGKFESAERPYGVQVYGADAETMARAAGMVTELFHPDFIDINFGCPVKKVVRNNGGSGCLKDLRLVQTIIHAVRGATTLPVTVKIRSGWDEVERDPVGIAQRCREAGAEAITLHARTRTQMVSGKANRDEIAQVVEGVDVP